MRYLGGGEGVPDDDLAVLRRADQMAIIIGPAAGEHLAGVSFQVPARLDVQLLHQAVQLVGVGNCVKTKQQQQQRLRVK